MSDEHDVIAEVFPGAGAAIDEMARRNGGWVCELHPDQGFPHGDCPGPGMLAADISEIVLTVQHHGHKWYVAWPYERCEVGGDRLAGLEYRMPSTEHEWLYAWWREWWCEPDGGYQSLAALVDGVAWMVRRQAPPERFVLCRGRRVVFDCDLPERRAA